MLVRRAWATAVVLLLLGLLGGAPRPADAATLNDVLDAWRARQAKVRSASMAWSENRVEMKGSPTLAGPAEGVNPTDAKDEHVFVHERTLVLNGDDVRFRWLLPTTGEEAIDSAFVAGVTRSYDPPTKLREGSLPQGLIHREDVYRQVQDSAVRPWMRFLRPMTASLSNLDVASLRVTGRTSLIGGQSCLELEIPPAQSGGVAYAYWIDPKWDFVIVRETCAVDGTPRWQANVDYATDPELGWRPVGWRFLRTLPSGELVSSRTCVVDSFMLNPPIGADAFTIDFPEGTIVSDLITNQKYAIRNGDKRLITREESMGASYEQIMATESGSAVRAVVEARDWFRASVIVAIAIVVLLLMGRFFWRWRAQAH
jgi:hypothetical protein